MYGFLFPSWNGCGNTSRKAPSPTCGHRCERNLAGRGLSRNLTKSTGIGRANLAPERERLRLDALRTFLPLIILFGLMWFLLIRPQQAQQRKRQEMLSRVKQGDQIVTIGGLHGQ